MRIGIIGSAGRKDDDPKFTTELYLQAFRWLINEISPIKEEITVVSGGAAYSDHLAVSLFKKRVVPKIELHLPAQITKDGFDPQSRDGMTANYYHGKFSGKVGANTLLSVWELRQYATVHAGFQARNRLVGQVDRLYAFTFGQHNSICRSGDRGYSSLEESGLKSGGTWNTWQGSRAGLKIHRDLHRFTT